MIDETSHNILVTYKSGSLIHASSTLDIKAGLQKVERNWGRRLCVLKRENNFKAKQMLWPLSFQLQDNQLSENYK